MPAVPLRPLALSVPSAARDRPTLILTDQDLAAIPTGAGQPRYACGVCRHLIFTGAPLAELQARYPGEKRLGMRCAKCGATNLAQVGPRPAISSRTPAP
jgi:ribosomal protein S27AE